jgi:hypothetical protein
MANRRAIAPRNKHDGAVVQGPDNMEKAAKGLGMQRLANSI